METYYSILEIPESATPEEIKQAYRLLLQVWHPDRFHHNPDLLAKAEQKTRQINAAFDTLSNAELKQRYDDGLRTSGARQGQHKPKPSGDEPRITRCPNAVCNSVLRVNARTVGVVTCPSCRTTFRYDPERNDKWDINPPEGDEFFTPARMAMLAIAVLFSVVIVFSVTKKSKVIVSNQPAHTHTDEHETLPRNEPLAFKEDEGVSHAASGGEGVSNQPLHTHTDEHETLPRNTPTAETPHEHMDHLEPMQRQMAQAPGRPPSPQLDIISDVDLQQLKTLAAQGHASAQTQLGQLYANGRGVPQDYATARGWYEKAAARGHAGAQAQLGQLYANGKGAPQDYQKARQWWEQAALQGSAQAQFNLGQLYANGRGIPQDYTAARGWYEKAAAQGYAWAQAQLGQLYATGRGVPQDYATARGWYEKAAAQGNAWAQAQLALL
jgi:hypothetical protein